MIHDIVLNGNAETYSIISKAMEKCKLDVVLGAKDDYAYFNHVKSTFEKLAELQFVHRLPSIDNVNAEKTNIPKFSHQSRPERFIVPELKFESKLNEFK